MKIKLDPGAKKPTLAHENDAGFDLYARESKVVPARGSATFDTGVHVELPWIETQVERNVVRRYFKTAGLLVSKSGLNTKHDITNEGLIDMDYTGAIKVKLYNNGDTDYTVHEGDKISQMIIVPIITPELELVDELEETERGDGGFGSTGR